MSNKLLVFAITIFMPAISYSYVGPGLGLGTIGIVFGVFASVFLTVLAILWYPIKRFFKRRKEYNRE